jgi:gephyrin
MEQEKMKAAILIVSDTASADPSTDKCIPVLKEVFGDSWDIINTSIVPDEVNAIQEYIKKWSDLEAFANCIVTSGGTGFAIKDNTPEVG